MSPEHVCASFVRQIQLVEKEKVQTLECILGRDMTKRDWDGLDGAAGAHLHDPRGQGKSFQQPIYSINQLAKMAVGGV